MTQHEQHMEAYATSILGVLQLIAKVGLFALQKTKILSVDAEDMLRKELSGYVNTANKTTVTQIKDDEAEKAAENKYLKLCQDSEDVCAKCVKVLTIMCAHKVPEDADSNIIEAWSVIKCTSGRIMATVDYWGNDGDMYTYQFPVTWLDLSRKQIAELKVGCQLV